jgi:lysophospholipid acyltransferase (LPLAT)-like uncharacterized protein
MMTADSEPKPVEARRRSTSVPRQLQWHGRLAAWMVHRVIVTLASTLRFQQQIPASTMELIRSRPVIFSAWHNRLALVLPGYQRILADQGPRRRMAAMVSASRDGAMVARILELFGAEPSRGSSSRRGSQALRELMSHAQDGLDLAITPDGPRGPCYVVQDGVIALAQLTQFPIIPGTCVLSRKWELKSWDKFQVPIPFSKWEVRTGEPLLVPRELSDADREKCRAELEKRMRALG